MCRRVEAVCEAVHAAPTPAAQSLIPDLTELVAALDALERRHAEARPQDAPATAIPQAKR